MSATMATAIIVTAGILGAAFAILDAVKNSSLGITDSVVVETQVELLVKAFNGKNLFEDFLQP